jgi:DNA-binding FadR family transcriptional regulator
MLSVSEAAHFFFKDNEGRAHLDQARLFLENSMLRYTVAHASNAQIAKLISAIEECDANLVDLNGFRLADVKFHRALAEVPGNPVFVALHETFVENMMKRAPIQEDFEEHNRISNEGHKDIVAAVLSQNEEDAVRALISHLTRNCESAFRRTMAGLKE